MSAEAAAAEGITANRGRANIERKNMQAVVKEVRPVRPPAETPAPDSTKVVTVEVPELCEIFEWAKNNVTSTLFICWAAQAGLYQKFGIEKYLLPSKMFGVFAHTLNNHDHPLLKDFDHIIYVPHSRHTNIKREDVVAEERLELLSESDEAGVYIMQEKGTRNFFITGHSEYALYTLDSEHKRDVHRGLPINIPTNYYLNDDPSQPPLNFWQGTAHKLFNNWLDFYVAGE